MSKTPVISYRQNDDEDFDGFCFECRMSCNMGICQNIDCVESPYFGEELDSPTLADVRAPSEASNG